MASPIDQSTLDAAKLITDTFSKAATGSIELFVNGKRHFVASPNPEETLLEYLRGQGLTGTKLGCGEVRLLPNDVDCCGVVV
jgi:xanthine dehydrogenase iron-sulfur cluster and FAD-binding subunit A